MIDEVIDETPDFEPFVVEVLDIPVDPPITCEDTDDWQTQIFRDVQSGTSCIITEGVCDESLEVGDMTANETCSSMITFAFSGTGSGRNFGEAQYRLTFEVDGITDGSVVIETVYYFEGETGCCEFPEFHNPPVAYSIEATITDGRVDVDVTDLYVPSSNSAQFRIYAQGGEEFTIVDPALDVC